MSKARLASDCPNARIRRSAEGTRPRDGAEVRGKASSTGVGQNSLVIPAHPGIQSFRRRTLTQRWPPAFAGVINLEALFFVASRATQSRLGDCGGASASAALCAMLMPRPKRTPLSVATYL